MKLSPWDPDLQTLVNRIDSGVLNLQPSFQRGEVWGLQKKRRLIDTILRQWHIPPVHVVEDPETEEHEVLDGQQRLAAVRDFVHGNITIDGTCPPEDSEIASLDGFCYEQLPPKFRRRFDNYSLRVIKIQDFTAEEPGELFYRLNQPTNLTAAEQRNAFYGPVRTQVKKLVQDFAKLGLDERTLGFKNSRMAYDDIVARVCFVHQEGTLRTKITAGVITALYRSGEPFDERVISRVSEALETFSRAMEPISARLKFNKATLFSWLAFISKLRAPGHTRVIGPDRIGEFILSFESERQFQRERLPFVNRADTPHFRNFPLTTTHSLLAVFNDRASARVADVSSVCARDFVLWCFASMFDPFDGNDAVAALPVSQAAHLRSFLKDPGVQYDATTNAIEKKIEDIVSGREWGRDL